MRYQRVQVIDHAVCTNCDLKQVVVEWITFIGLFGLDRGEVGLGNFGQLDVWDHDFSRHFVDRDAYTTILLVKILNLRGLFLLDFLLVLDQLVNILLELADPNFLLVPSSMAQVVANDAILCVRNKLVLSLFIKRMEDNHSECRCLAGIDIKGCFEVFRVLDLENRDVIRLNCPRQGFFLFPLL